MGLFDKIKNILFEDDEEEVEIPVYSKEEVNTKESKKEEKKKEKEEKVEFEPIQTEETSRFKNIKRDFDFSFDEDEQLEDLISSPVIEKVEEKEEETVVEATPVKQPEKKDVFLSFDEEEFERLNSKINHNEEKARRETRRDVHIRKDEEDAMLIARRANSNFSSTTPTVNAKDYSRDTDRYKINTGKDVKKPFTPSPVISPVYGILDKNYTKDSIVDKKDGMKRERVRPIKTEVVLESEIEKQEELKRIEEENNKVESKKVNIDLVRKKAYGALEENVAKLEDEQVSIRKKNVVLTTVGEQEDLVEFQEKFGDDIVDDAMLAVANYNTSKTVETKEEKINNIEDEVEEDLNKTKVQEYDNSIKEVKKNSDESKSKILDDLEKTSTLQILEDIEKELNSIKPISKEVEADEDYLSQKAEREKEEAAYDKWCKELGLIPGKTQNQPYKSKYLKNV